MRRIAITVAACCVLAGTAVFSAQAADPPVWVFSSGVGLDDPAPLRGRAAASSAAVVAQASAGPRTSERQPVWVFSTGVGLETHYQRYVETVQDATFMKQDGWFHGVTLDARLEAGPWQFRGDLRYAWGTIDYAGSGTAQDIDDTVFEGRVLLARVFPVASGGKIIPYAGFGYRRLEDGFGGVATSTGALGYDRISQYYYIPVGVEGTFPLGRGWHVKPTVEFDHLVRGSQTSELSSLLPGLADLENEQNKGYGLRGSVMLSSTVLRTPVEFGPYLRYWKIADSNSAPLTFNGVTVARGLEPANETIEAGVALKLWY